VKDSRHESIQTCAAELAQLSEWEIIVPLILHDACAS
jgi:hypothetical protein